MKKNPNTGYNLNINILFLSMIFKYEFLFLIVIFNYELFIFNCDLKKIIYSSNKVLILFENIKTTLFY